MLYIGANGVDITGAVDRNSVQIVEQLNNRSNTARFSITDLKVTEGQEIQIREYTTLREDANSGQAVLQVAETFEISDKFRPGDTLWLVFDTAQAKKVTIQTIDHTNFTITLTANLSVQYKRGDKIGVKRYAGIVQNAPEKERTRGSCANPGLERDVAVTDYKSLLDRKNVAETYADMYLREIIGRIVYKFCANDKDATFFDCETTGTNSGVAGVQTFDTVDRIQGNKSIKFSMSGPGVGTQNMTVSSFDLSQYDKLRFWWKEKAGYGKFVSAFQVRVGQNTSNYFGYNVTNIGIDFENCRNLESLDLSEPDAIVGSPTLTGTTNIRFVFTVTGAMPSDGIHIDHIQAFSGGFTLQNAMRGDIVYDDIRVQYKKPSTAIENLTKLTNEYWFVDYNRDIHYYGSLGDDVAPYTLTDTSENFGDLSIDADITNLVNTQVVRGGEAPDELDYTQDEVSDGKQESYRLDYKPKDLRIYVDTTGTGSSFVQKTVGVENLVDASTVDYVFNFQEKVVRRGIAGILPAGAIFRRVYKPYRPIRVRSKDNTSVAKMKLLTGGDGVYEGAAIVEPKIKTFQEARQRAKAEIDAYKNPIVTVTFKTNFDGLKPGQLIHVLDTDRDIDDKYMIQKVTRSAKNIDYWSYSVIASSTLFGITEFLQLLLKRSDRWEVDASELVDIVQNIDEVITLQDQYTFSRTSLPFKAGLINKKTRDFKTQRFANSNPNGVSNNQKVMNDWYADNYGTKSYSTSHFVAENPLLQMQVLDGKPYDVQTRTMLVGQAFGTGALYKSSTYTKDRLGNAQGALSFTEAGYINVPYGSLTSTPANLSILIEHKPLGTVSAQDYAILARAGLLIVANQSKIRIWTNVGQPTFDYTRTNAGVWEKIAITVTYNAPNSRVKMWIDGSLVLDNTFSYGSIGSGSRPSSTVGTIGCWYPNVDNRGYRGEISEIQIYDRILTDRQLQDWSKGYTDCKGLTLVSGNSTPAGNRPSAWTVHKVKPSTQYEIIAYSEILDALTNDAGGGGLYCRVAGYATRRVGGDVGWSTGQLFNQDFIVAKKNQHDWERILGTFTTTASTQWINLGLYLYNATGIGRFNDIQIREIGSETVTNPARANYAIAT